MLDITSEDIQLYKDVAYGKENRLSSEQVLALGQPMSPSLQMFKLFVYLLKRIEVLEAKNANRENAARVANAAGR
jgi:hypothetical protein